MAKNQHFLRYKIGYTHTHTAKHNILNEHLCNRKKEKKDKIMKHFRYFYFINYLPLWRCKNDIVVFIIQARHGYMVA